MDVWMAIELLLILALGCGMCLALVFSITYRQDKALKHILDIIEMVNKERAEEADLLRIDIARLKHRLEEIEKHVYG